MQSGESDSHKGCGPNRMCRVAESASAGDQSPVNKMHDSTEMPSLLEGGTYVLANVLTPRLHPKL